MQLTVKQLADIVESRYGDPANFVSNVKVWLAQHGLTQTDLAHEIGTDPTSVNRWLNGRIVPSLKNMLLVDEALERLIDQGDV